MVDGPLLDLATFFSGFDTADSLPLRSIDKAIFVLTAFAETIECDLTTFLSDGGGGGLDVGEAGLDVEEAGLDVGFAGLDVEEAGRAC